MEKENKPQKKPNSFEIFLEEIQHSSWIVTFLAIMTGIILGGLLAAITSLEMYAAFKISFWDGIKTGLQVAWSTYSALFHRISGRFWQDQISIGWRRRVGNSPRFLPLL